MGLTQGLLADTFGSHNSCVYAFRLSGHSKRFNDLPCQIAPDFLVSPLKGFLWDFTLPCRFLFLGFFGFMEFDELRVLVEHLNINSF